jgi:hypothetical protein
MTAGTAEREQNIFYYNRSANVSSDEKVRGYNVVCGVVKMKTTTKKLVSRDREEHISVMNEFVNNRWNFRSRKRQAGIRVKKKEDRCVKTRRVDSTKWFTARNISRVLKAECKVTIRLECES